ncbi:J domain-containing protein [Thermomicrobium sp. 4228-Ro]|uniref:J domain-containing protein n=1 Tax=Thermomicrobium sp. 4228-Ro TaxID=2993937 RepID=UPI002B05D94B|nr:J domain-containing protein [Thermomicrobium sp. 4228-Ro]
MTGLGDFDPTLDYYQILGVPVTATLEEIRRAYRQLMRATHPDRVRDPDKRRIAEERAKLLNAAYAVLSDPERRRVYDEQLRQRAVTDLLFQRYTAPSPAWVRPAPSRRSRQTMADDLAAFVQLLAVTVIFVATLVLLLVASSALSGLFGSLS